MAGSAVLIKNSIGVAAVIVMAVIIGIPLLSIVMALLYQFLSSIRTCGRQPYSQSCSVLSGSLENMIYMIASQLFLCA
ncbi:MAG: stage III sporulation protein AE [Lachnospira eligens]